MTNDGVELSEKNSDGTSSEKVASKKDKKDKKDKKVLKVVGIIFSLLIIIIVLWTFFGLDHYCELVWSNIACTVNEIYQEFTNTDNELLPEFYSGYEDAKPVIYLYPEKEIDIEVKLDKVNFTATYPEYKNSWVVKARPNGVLIDSNNREYNYLYWEGYSGYKPDISSGFVVKKDDYILFFEEKLEYMGLSDKEACDFISYWLPICNKYEYSLISFQPDYGDVVKIDYSIEPDNELVVFAAIKGLDKPIDISEQDLSVYKDFKREGFVSVEWGGTLLSDD